MKLSLIIEAIDRASGPAKKATAAFRQLTDRGLKPLDQAAQRVDRTSARFMVGMPARLAAITAGVRRLAGRAGMKALEKSSYAAGYAVGATLRKVGQLALRVGSMGAVALGAGGVGALGWLTAGVIGTGAKFEQLRVRLETALGSAAAAQRGLDFIKKFAEDTPYELDQVTAAFIAAKNEGIDPFSKAMTTMGDAASGQGTDYVEMVKAVGDAQRKQFERLLEYGIKGSSKGGLVALSYIDRQGKEVSRRVRDNMKDIQTAVLDILGEKFGGGMARQSRTLIGLWSTLKDKITGFQLDIADAGFFDYVKGRLEALLAKINQMARSGELKKWAEDISARLTDMTTKAYEFVSRVRWDEVAKGIGTIVKGLVDFVAWVNRASDAYELWQLKAARTRELGSYDKVWNRMFGGTYERSQQRENIRAYNRALGLPENKGLEGEPDDKPRDLPATKGWIGNQQRSLRQYLDRRPPAAGGPAPTGKISLHVTTDRGVTAQPRKVEARGMQIELNTGRAMTGVA